jgi:hypothetical protein
MAAGTHHPPPIARILAVRPAYNATSRSADRSLPRRHSKPASSMNVISFWRRQSSAVASRAFPRHLRTMLELVTTRRFSQGFVYLRYRILRT